MFAPLTLVPWGIGLIARGERDVALLAWALRSWAPCSIAAVVSLYLPAGALAAGLSAAWALPTGLIALEGVRRGLEMARGERTRHPEELCMLAGMLYLPGAVVWWAASRFGLELMGFPLTSVQLTSIRVHYAGFTAPLLCALTGRAVRAHGGVHQVKAYTLISLVVALGMPIIAAGITFSPTIEMISTIIFSLGLLGVSIATFTTLRSHASVTAKILLGASSLSLFVSMAAASVYALRYVGAPTVTIGEMAVIHGIVNCLGFAGAGVAGWTWSAHTDTADRSVEPMGKKRLNSTPST